MRICKSPAIPSDPLPVQVRDARNASGVRSPEDADEDALMREGCEAEKGLSASFPARIQRFAFLEHC